MNDHSETDKDECVEGPSSSSLLLEGYSIRNDDLLVDSMGSTGESVERSSRALMNFVHMSILFSANHGAMVSCLAFATLQLGSTGAWELALLHLVYAASALLGSTYVVKQCGARNSMALGMSLHAVYVLCFWSSLQWPPLRDELAILGAITGGFGGGVVWTGQGSYFGSAATEFAECNLKNSGDATSYLAGIFAFIYLSGEVACKLLSWITLKATNSTWKTVMGIYCIVAITSTILMGWVHNYPTESSARNFSLTHKVTAALRLMVRDPKMKYMVGLNAAFGLACPFVNSFVNGEVVHRVLLNDSKLHYVGLFSAMSAAVAAICSIVFGALTQNKGSVLIFGGLSFAMVAAPFLIQPDFGSWGWRTLVMVYTFQGVGRSTFEGALRAVFADLFSDEKEGAYANIILQNGLFTAIGFLLSYCVPCPTKNHFCLEFQDGQLHNIFVLEVALVVSAFLAIIGYLRATMLVTSMHREESRTIFERLLVEDQPVDADIEPL